MLADDDPLWENHSGGDGHRGIEWGSDDGTRAEAFYTALPQNARFIFDLLMEHPGERLTVNWIAGQMSHRQTASTRVVGRRSVSSSLSAAAVPRERSGRRLPFYWWRGSGGASLYAMKPAVAQLFRDARRDAGENIDHGGDWSPAEVRATVSDYLAMLAAELAGQRYSKTDHRRVLLAQLNPVRTAAAVEWKHQNISAAMVDLGLPYIRGYKPRSNYQTVLTREIQRHLEAEPQLLGNLQTGNTTGVPAKGRLRRTAPPAPTALATASPGTGSQTGRHPDYGVLQKENRLRGAQGEELVLDFERDCLRQHGRADLASRVRWTARDDGDGLGYDILSFDAQGQQRYIEVKTTALGEQTPFYITCAELDFAQRHADRYALYRVYDVLSQPRFYALEGDISRAVELTPMTYSARISATAPADGMNGGGADSIEDPAVQVGP